MDNITKSLEDYLRRRNSDDIDLDGVQEMDQIDYDRTMRAMMSGYEAQVNRMVQQYNDMAEMMAEVESLRHTHILRYYELPGGEIGYAIIGRKQAGFGLDGGNT